MNEGKGLNRTRNWLVGRYGNNCGQSKSWQTLRVCGGSLGEHFICGG